MPEVQVVGAHEDPRLAGDLVAEVDLPRVVPRAVDEGSDDRLGVGLARAGCDRLVVVRRAEEDDLVWADRALREGVEQWPVPFGPAQLRHEYRDHQLARSSRFRSRCDSPKHAQDDLADLVEREAVEPELAIGFRDRRASRADIALVSSAVGLAPLLAATVATHLPRLAGLRVARRSRGHVVRISAARTPQRHGKLGDTHWPRIEPAPVGMPAG